MDGIFSRVPKFAHILKGWSNVSKKKVITRKGATDQQNNR